VKALTESTLSFLSLKLYCLRGFGNSGLIRDNPAKRYSEGCEFLAPRYTGVTMNDTDRLAYEYRRQLTLQMWTDCDPSLRIYTMPRCDEFFGDSNTKAHMWESSDVGQCWSEEIFSELN
jgi:hypothetical protein